MIDQFKTTCMRPDAEWINGRCPECGHKFVAKDRFGLYCCNSACDWVKDNDIFVDLPTPLVGSEMTPHLCIDK